MTFMQKNLLSLAMLALAVFLAPCFAQENAAYTFPFTQEAFRKTTEVRNASLSETDGKPCIRLEGASLWRAALEPTNFAGKTVWLEYEYKLEGVSANPEKKSTHGFIARLVCKRQNGKSIYFHKAPVTGTTEWEISRQKITIPADTVAMTIGIQTPVGKALVRKLAIFPAQAEPAKPAEPKTVTKKTAAPKAVFADLQGNGFEFPFTLEAFKKTTEVKNASLAESDGKPCLQLAGASLWRAALEPTNFAGKTVWLEYEYKLEGVSANPEKKSTHGFIARLVCKRQNGKSIYFHKAPVTGDCDWTAARYKFLVPEDTVSMTIGIQTPDGKALVRRLALVLPTVNISSPQQRQNLSPISKKPVIDGIFTPQEWADCASDHNFVSQSTGQKVKRDVFVYYGYDRDNFYFCQLCSIPQKPQTLTSRDTLEVTLLSPDKKKVQFSVTPDGGKGLPEGTRLGTAVSGKQPLTAGFPSTGKWIVELAVPWKFLGLDAAPDNDTWQLQVRRLWKNPDEIALLDVKELLFSRGTPSCAFSIATYGVSARINGNLFNPTDKPRNVTLDIMIKSLEVPHSLNAKITIPAHGRKDFQQYFMVGGATDRNFDIQVNGEDGKPIYNRNYNWNANVGHDFFNPDPPILFKSGMSPSKRRILAHLSCANPKKLADAEKVDFQIINADDVLVQRIDAEKRTDGLYSKYWEYPELPPGKYTLLAELTRKDGKKEQFRNTFKLMHFNWQGNTIGLERTVPPPFKPLQASGSEVHALLTGYRANGVFWNAVYAQKQNILAAPVQIYVNGKNFKTDSEEWTERAEDRVIRHSTHSMEGLSLDTVHEYEFDGVCKTTLRFKPQAGFKAQSLWIDIPLLPEVAKLYHHVGFGIRSNPSEWIPQGKGSVWKLPWNPARFPNYIWFGETFKGMCFFTDMTPPPYDRKSGFTTYELLRSPGRVTLRFHLAPQGSQEELKPFEWVCGFQPTPVKPRPEGFRRYGAHMWTAKLPNTHMLYQTAWYKHFFSDIGFGQPLVPYGNDPSWLEYIYSGQQNNESREQIMTRIASHLKKHNMTDEKWNRLYGAKTHDTSSLTTRMRQGAIFTRNKEVGLYLNPRGGYRCWPESEMYDAEWMYSGFFAPDDNHYHRHPVPSYVDMMLYKTRDYLRQFPGCKGLYYDNLYPAKKSSPFWGARETSPGSYTYVGDIFEMRELLKRTLRLCHQEKRNLLSDANYAWLVVHMTDANIVPVMGLASVNLGWEMKFGRQDFQDRFPEAFHLVQSLGTQTGTVPMAITVTSGNKEERLHQQRTLYAVGFAFDMLNFSDSGSREEDASPIFNKMQFLIREFGYGMPNVEHFPGYEPQSNPATCDASQVRITTMKRKDGQLMLLIGNLGDAAKVTLSFKGIQVANLKNAETGTPIQGNQLELQKHDCAVLIGTWK